MNNVIVTQRPIPRTVFLAGLAQCPSCSGYAAPSAGERNFVRMYLAKTGTARCDACQTLTVYNLDTAGAA